VNTRWQVRTIRWIGGAVRRLLPREAVFKRRLYTIHLVPLIFLSVVSFCWCQSSGPTETQVKAAYLYNFGKFVTWQPDRVATSDSLQICVLGKDPFGAVLDSTVAGESVDGRKITVRRIAKVQDAGSCSILFVSSSEEGRLGSVLNSAQASSVLTISDMPHFAEKGGVIGFVKQADRIRFEVNRKAAEQSHLVLSSELLKVAVKVFGN
jgi:uncharacterized protein DUF4154